MADCFLCGQAAPDETAQPCPVCQGQNPRHCPFCGGTATYTPPSLCGYCHKIDQED